MKNILYLILGAAIGSSIVEIVQDIWIFLENPMVWVLSIIATSYFILLIWGNKHLAWLFGGIATILTMRFFVISDPEHGCSGYLFGGTVSVFLLAMVGLIKMLFKRKGPL